jgi:ABC-2 type transport system permease protein
MIPASFSPQRFLAMVLKEFIQMRRDRLTFGMMVGIPMLQLLVFGFAINLNPRHLPAAILAKDNSPFVRTLVWGLKNTGYFDIRHVAQSPDEATRLLREGDVQFVLTIPEDFSRQLLRGHHPAILLEADATDPAATGPAVAAVETLASRIFQRDLKGLPVAQPHTPPAVRLLIHRNYNPEIMTQFNIVPGLLGVVLTMTMVMITALAITRERERGTMENLLATPIRPLEVMAGKILPYILVGYVQTTLILLAAVLLFKVPFLGSLPLLLSIMLLFIVANLAVGITFSTVARNQLQAVQMSFFFFLPSILLSGFMFPFRGMPLWAQTLGELLPLTHFLRIVRGILLKGNGWTELRLEVAAILAFLFTVITIAFKRYRQTLD